MPRHDEWEIAKAWTLWNSLHEYAAMLWDKYEQPFSEFLEERDLQVEGHSEIELKDEDIPY